jgi:hypothetical protein
VSVEGLIEEVRRRRTTEVPLHVTAILILASADLDRGGDDQLALARLGWSAVRAEGATDRFPSLSHPTLELVRSGMDLSDEAFLALPDDDQVNVVLMGFLSLVGERLADDQPAKGDQPAKLARPPKRAAKSPKPKYRTIRPRAQPSP